MRDYYRCYAKISLSAVRHNINEVKKRLPDGVKTLAVIKANAYGHGAERLAECLADLVDYYAVATLEEAEQLREKGITMPVMILGYTSPRKYDDLVRQSITQTIYSLEDAKKLDEAAARVGKNAIVHIALDTGMTRIGFQVEEAEADRIAEISRLPHITLEGMFTHFACADQQDKSYCTMQLQQFDSMAAMLEKRKVSIPILHVCNSAGIMEFTEHRYDMVRSGIVTYGLYPSDDVQKENMDLIPALEWKTHVIHVKDVPPGKGVSYGATYVTEKPVTRIATISAGYADGYPRSLSSRGKVLIHGQWAPIIGRICMDQMMADVTDIPDVQVEDTVTLIGQDGENRITAEELGACSGRFNYELVCDISERVPRIYE